MMGAPKWIFACEGKARPGDSPGLAGIHVWRPAPDGTATCLKCGENMTPERRAEIARKAAAKRWGKAT